MGWNSGVDYVQDNGWYRPQPVSSGSAVLTFQGEQGYAVNHDAIASPNTFVAMPVGAAFSTREVIAVITTGGSYNGVATGVTIGGVTATFQSYVGSGGGTAGSFSNIITLAWANVPTGTTADVVLTGAASSGDSHIQCAVYTFDKSLALNSAPTTNSVNAAAPVTSNTTTVNSGAGGFIIAALATDLLGTESGLSITSSTETYAQDAVATATPPARIISSKKSGSAANTPTSVTWGWTGNSQGLGALLAWN